jgi:hypothetical protein
VAVVREVEERQRERLAMYGQAFVDRDPAMTRSGCGTRPGQSTTNSRGGSKMRSWRVLAVIATKTLQDLALTTRFEQALVDSSGGPVS